LIIRKVKKAHNSNQVNTYLNPVVRLNPIIISQNSKHIIHNKVNNLSVNLKITRNNLHLNCVLDYFGVMFLVENPFIFTIGSSRTINKYLFLYKNTLLSLRQPPNYLTTLHTYGSTYTNLVPSLIFKKVIFKKLYSSSSLKKLRLNFIPIYQNTLVRFIEFTSGNKILLQFNPFVKDSVTVM
jgi:hypothetical protein